MAGGAEILARAFDDGSGLLDIAFEPALGVRLVSRQIRQGKKQGDSAADKFWLSQTASETPLSYLA